MRGSSDHWSSHLPFYFGWLIVGIAFVTMGIGVTARTAFSLLMPPLIDEFGWHRGLAAGAFSFGFLVSAVLSAIVGRVMDARGPRVVILTGVLLITAGLLLAPSIERPWHLYATLGVLVSAGANMMTYTAHSQFLPNWFVRCDRHCLLGRWCWGHHPAAMAAVDHRDGRLACFVLGHGAARNFRTRST
jgi:MFS family permease